MEDKDSLETIPGQNPVNTPENPIAPESSEYTKLMQELETLRVNGRMVVDVIKADQERNLPKTVVIPVEAESKDPSEHPGVVFITEKGVFFDQHVLSEMHRPFEQDYKRDTGRAKGKPLPERFAEFNKWVLVIRYIEGKSIVREIADAGQRDHLVDLMISPYRNSERHFKRAEPELMRQALEESKHRASRMAPLAEPSAQSYMDAVK